MLEQSCDTELKFYLTYSSKLEIWSQISLIGYAIVIEVDKHILCHTIEMQDLEATRKMWYSVNGWGISTVSNPNINTGAFSRNKNQAIFIVYSNAFEMFLNTD